MRNHFLILITALIIPCALMAKLKPSWLFNDNCVLQQECPIPVWGTASDGTTVTVTLGEVSLCTIADSDGNWKVFFPKMKADGKAYSLKIACETEKLEYGNVKIGEVWVASGQSNMEYHVQDGVLDHDKEVAEANYPDIRYFPAGLDTSPIEVKDAPSRAWRPITPQTVGEMSAVAYFFAKQLHGDRKVPVGVIVAARGATEIGTWISAKMLQTHPVYRERVKNFSEQAWRQRARQTERDNIVRDSILKYSFRGLKEGVVQTKYDDSKWDKVNFPLKLWDLTQVDFWGVIWFRKHFNLTAEQAKKSWTLVLPINDVGDTQYMNGKVVGSKSSIIPEVIRVPIDKSTLRAGSNVFALRMNTTWGLCNIGNDIDNECYLVSQSGERVDFRGEWKFNTKLEPAASTLSNYYNEPTVNFNGMISPIVGYGIRGFIWYQGEGNTGYYPEEYVNLKRMLIEDWRVRWGMGYLPFIFVQLANMNVHSDTPRAYDSWAVLRDSQTAVLDAVPNTAMASAIDVGEWNNAHPINKQEVGRRLYRAAQANVYGDPVEGSGPTLKQVKYDSGKLVLSYDHVASGLKSDGKPLNSFAVADAAGNWRWVNASISGSDVVIDLQGIDTPTRVQYAWQANPEANLYNSDHLPAIPFNVTVNK